MSGENLMRAARNRARKRRRTSAFRTLVHEYGLKPAVALDLLRMAQEAGRQAAATAREDKR